MQITIKKIKELEDVRCFDCRYDLVFNPFTDTAFCDNCGAVFYQDEIEEAKIYEARSYREIEERDCG